MARKRQSTVTRLVAAAFHHVAAMLIWAGQIYAGPGLDWSATQILPAELRVTLGDVKRLADDGLPPRHVEGLNARIQGALGLLPWLLIRAGDEGGAEALASWVSRPLDTTQDRTALASLLTALAEDYPLGLEGRMGFAPPAAELAEAGAIHETYCMGCHDGFADGDPETSLPSRDLRQMARAEPGDIFLARLINGVKGDETIAFVNPLTERQVLALWAYYRTSQVPDTGE